MTQAKSVTGAALCLAALAALALAASRPALAQPTPLGTTFTYQGRLTDGGVGATGTYDFELNLFDAASGGSQIGSTLDRADIAVADGLFIVALDFGASAFTGNARWLEISVRPGASSGAYTTLSGRQELTPVPNALQASTLGGHDSAYHLSRGNHTGTQPSSSLSPQGAGSGLDADTVDGMHASQLLAGGVNKVVRGVITFGGANYEVGAQFSPSVDPTRSVVILSPWVLIPGNGTYNNNRDGAILVDLTSNRITVAIDDFNTTSIHPLRVSYQIIEYK